MPLARPRSRCCDRFVFGRLGRGRRINEPRTGDPCADGKDRGPVAWHPGHDTTLTPAILGPGTGRQVCHSLATLPGHRRATHAPGRHSRVVPSCALPPRPRGACADGKDRGPAAHPLAPRMGSYQGRRSRPLPGHLRRPGGTVRVAADERFTAVLNSITKAAAVQCGVPHPPPDRGGGDRRPRTRQALAALHAGG